MAFGNKAERAAKKVMRERDLPAHYGALLIVFDSEKIKNAFDTPLYGRKAYELLFKHIRLGDLYPENYYPQFYSGDLPSRHRAFFKYMPSGNYFYSGNLSNDSPEDFWVIAIEGFCDGENAISKLANAIQMSSLGDYVSIIQFVEFIEFFQLPFVYDCRLSLGQDPRDDSYLAYCLMKEADNNMASRDFKIIFGDTLIEKEASIRKQDLWVEMDQKQ